MADLQTYTHTHIHTYIHTYRVSGEEVWAPIVSPPDILQISEVIGTGRQWLSFTCVRVPLWYGIALSHCKLVLFNTKDN